MGYPPAGYLPEGRPERESRPSRGLRLLAWLIDFAIVVAVAVLLGVFTFHRISGELTGPGLVEQSVWQVINSHGDLPGTAENIGLSLWHHAVRDVEQGFALLVLFAFVYHFTTLLLLRRTVGKAVVGLRIAPNGLGAPGPLGRRRAAVRAAVTALTDVGCYALAWCLLLEGAFVLAWLCWLASAAIFLFNAAPTLLGSGRSCADRCAGTLVTRVRLAETVAYAADRGRAVWQGGRQAAQQVVDQERLRRIAESEHAQRMAGLGRAAWQGTRQGAQDGAQRAMGRVRQAADSDLGRAAAERGRAAVNRAAGRFRRPGSPGPTPPTPPAPPYSGPPPVQPPPGFAAPPSAPPPSTTRSMPPPPSGPPSAPPSGPRGSGGPGSGAPGSGAPGVG